MFFGTFTPKLDEKGRLTLPAKFRDMTAGGVMVTRGQDRSLYVYLPSDFQDLADRLRAASRDSEAARAYRRALFANTDEQRPDGQGRITINGEHRTYAGLSKECVVIGNDDRMEIWDAASWREYQDHHEEDFSRSGVEVLEPGH